MHPSNDNNKHYTAIIRKPAGIWPQLRTAAKYYYPNVFADSNQCNWTIKIMHPSSPQWYYLHPWALRILACFVFSSLSGHAPSYLSDDIHLVSEGPRRHLRSSTDRSCVVPRTYNTFGDRSFAVARPRVWNSLPGHLRDKDITYSSFRRELKTYWFSCNRGAMWHRA